MQSWPKPSEDSVRSRCSNQACPVFESLTGGVALGSLHCLHASASPSVKWAAVKVEQRLEAPGQVEPQVRHTAKPTRPSFPHSPVGPLCDLVLAKWPVMFATSRSGPKGSHRESRGARWGPRRWQNHEGKGAGSLDNVMCQVPELSWTLSWVSNGPYCISPWTLGPVCYSTWFALTHTEV